MSDNKKRLLPGILAVAIFIDTLDSTIVSVAIPAIAKNFAINPIDMKLALTSYLLSLAVFIPISGWLADKFGDKKTFILAIGIFTFSSILCALSPNLPSLIISRTIQGFGGALLMPVGRLILLRTFTRAEFGKAMGSAVVPGLLGIALGPTIGGLILNIASWHWIFLINVPLGIIGTLLSLYIIQSSLPQTPPPFNWSGFTLFSLGLVLITLSMALVGDNFDLLPYSLLLGGLAVIFLAAYWKRSKKQTFPLLDITLFQQKIFSIAMIVSLIARPSLGAIPFLLPLLLQVVWHKTALYSGLIFMSFALGMMSARYLIAQKLLKQYGYRAMLFLSVACISILMLNLSWFGHFNQFYFIIPLLFFMGMFSSQFYSTIGTMSVVGIAPESFSQSISISSTVQQFAIGLGIAMSAVLLHIVSMLLHKPLFSGVVFGWTFSILSVINLFSFPFIRQLDPELKLA